MQRDKQIDFKFLNIGSDLFAATRRHLTFGLLPGWLDVVAISSRSLISSGQGRPVLNLDFVIFKFNLLTRFCGWADGSQKPARQQAVAVSCKPYSCGSLINSTKLNFQVMPSLCLDTFIISGFFILGQVWQSCLRLKRKAAANMGFYASWADGNAIGIFAYPSGIGVRRL